jgi:hypothetical protein
MDNKVCKECKSFNQLKSFRIEGVNSIKTMKLFHDQKGLIINDTIIYIFDLRKAYDTSITSENGSCKELRVIFDE